MAGFTDALNAGMVSLPQLVVPGDAAAQLAGAALMPAAPFMTEDAQMQLLSQLEQVGGWVCGYVCQQMWGCPGRCRGLCLSLAASWARSYPCSPPCFDTHPAPHLHTTGHWRPDVWFC